MLGRWAHVVSHYPRRTLLAILLLTIGSAFVARDVTFDEQFSALVAAKGPDAQIRDDYRATWGAEDNVLVAVIHADEPIEHLPLFIERITNRAKQDVAEFQHVLSASNAPVVIPTPEGNRLGPAFGPTSPFTGTLDQRVDLVRNSNLGASNLVSEDGRTFVVMGELEPGFETFAELQGPAASFTHAVEDEVARARLPISVSYSGLAFNRLAGVEQVRDDLVRLVPAAALLAAIILWLVFRRAAAVLAPLCSVIAAVTFTAALMRVMGASINGVTTMYPILLMGVVVSSSTHLMHRYFTERGAGHDPTQAAHATLCSIGRAAFVAAVTTAAGFASLASADLDLLHDFGVHLAIGVMAAFALQCTVITAFLAWRKTEPTARYFQLAGAAASNDLAPGTTSGWTRRYAQWVTQPAIALLTLLIAGGLTVAGLLSFHNVSYDYEISDGVDPDSSVGTGNRLMNEQLSGIVPLEISLTGTPGTFTRLDVIQREQALAEWLQQTYGTRTVGIPMLLAAEQALLTGGTPSLPTDQQKVDDLLALARTYQGGEILKSLLSPDGSRTRLRGLTPDRGGQHLLALRDQVEHKGTELFAGTGVDVNLTGAAPAAYAGMRNLTDELVTSTLLAIGVIVFAMLLVFRNGWVAMIGILPNAIPVVVGLAGYRLASPSVNPVASIVFCIAVGLAADDTIHLISRWREVARRTPVTTRDHSRRALVSALVMARKAMVSSTLVLMAGFGVLTLSNLHQNKELGLLGSYVLGLALVADLVAGTAGIALLAAWHDHRRNRSGRTVLDVPVPVGAT